ncbi:MAG: HisA/HisF-related TIM barrel protein [Candidatus Bathyarchaeota archaeon]|nr:HisA/HisF-related TIM barrel protein [Candidatus Bathyarchaeota archaeon]
MKVIPVMDVLNGVAVHAVRGRRKEYQPLKSLLCSSADPVDVAKAIAALGFSEMYVADLDAIMGGRTNFSLFRQIADETGLELMVDAGVANIERARKMVKNHVAKIVVGTETLQNVDFIEETIEAFGKDRVVVSLDMVDGKVLSKLNDAMCVQPLVLLRTFQEMGVNQVILLDLARVGSGEGVNLPVLKQALACLSIKVFVGGGVRDIKDLVTLKNLGVSGVLLATALHSGRILPEALKRERLLG